MNRNARTNCEACWHLMSLHGPGGCSAKVYPAHSLTGEPCPCEHVPETGDWDEEIAEAMAESRHCTRCGDILRRSETLIGTWLSDEVPVPGIGQPGERPGVCRAGDDPFTVHVPGKPTKEG
jgi:hypothetical protein